MEPYTNAISIATLRGVFDEEYQCELGEVGGGLFHRKTLWDDRLIYVKPLSHEPLYVAVRMADAGFEATLWILNGQTHRKLPLFGIYPVSVAEP